MLWLRRWLIPLVLLLPLSALGQAATDAEKLIVEALSCRGNAVTSCDFILGHVYLVRGDVVDEEEIGNARLRLASLPRPRGEATAVSTKVDRCQRETRAGP